MSPLKDYNSNKNKFFSMVSHMYKWKPNFELFIIVSFIISFLSQITLLDYATINTNSHIYESKFYVNLKQYSHYIYFHKNELLKNIEGKEEVCLGITLGLNLIYIILILLIFNKQDKNWQGYILLTLNYLVMALVLPIHVFFVYFTQSSM